VHAQDDKALLREVLVPTRVPRVVAHAVDSAKRPEMQHDDFPAEVLEG
jgi:hypothetical protein